MPGLVTSWIMEHCAGALTSKTLWCFKRDIDNCNDYGMAYDAETWMRFRAWVERQENEAMNSGYSQKQHWTADVIKNSDELKKLIAENPDLPIVVLAGDEANNGDYNWCFCSTLYFEITEILTVETPYDAEDERAFMDRDYFEERMEDCLCDDDRFADDAEREAFMKTEMQKYDPYWKKVIAIYADN